MGFDDFIKYSILAIILYSYMANLPVTIGSYRKYNYCRLCLSDRIATVIDLGYVPLAGAFHKKNSSNTPELSYPLTLGFCEECLTLQTLVVVEADSMFQNYYYRSSSINTLVTHFETISILVNEVLKNKGKSFVVEIGCNDGSLISSLREKKINAVGIDPAKNIVKPLIKKGLPIINDYFTYDLAKRVVKKYGKANVIYSANTLAHIEDMRDVFKGIHALLKKDGELIMEVHYLGTLITETQYDMMYHEHQYYWSVTSLNNVLKPFGLEVFDVIKTSIHGGSAQFHIGHINQHNITGNVIVLTSEEKKNKLNTKNSFHEFYKKILSEKKELLKLLRSLKSQKKSIAGYGASGRGTILSSFCQLTSDYLDFVIDDSPAKQGAYTPFNHLPIVDSSILKKKARPDYVLLFAWSFIEEIKKRNPEYISNGGKYIVPLPKVKVVK